MENIQEAIASEWLKNIEHRSFVPYSRLKRLLQKDVVGGLLVSTSLQAYLIEDTAGAILRGGQKTFAILVLISKPELVVLFLHIDQFQFRTSIDSKLPYTLAHLESILPSHHIASSFYERQWGFIAPVFSGSIMPRVLADETILPFVQERELGSGGFGVVYEDHIEESHQMMKHLSSQTVARKEFKVTGLESDDYEHELHNLSMLKLLRHPNIIELLGSYTFRRKHNFLFPVAPSGSLTEMLKTERPALFRSDKAILRALAGIGSAIAAVHNFTAESVNLGAIGCHHDLKPSNILVDGSKFILADFGLARLKEATDDSATRFRHGAGDYLAPECHALGGGAERYIINRASDVWSFGAIILEILTYMVSGPSGVSDFRHERMFDLGVCTLYRFHRGPGTSHEAVTRRLVQLQGSDSEPIRLLSDLARKMLSVSPTERPRAAEVEATLFQTATSDSSRPLNICFVEARSQVDCIEAKTEHQRYTSWETIVLAPFDDRTTVQSFWANLYIQDFHALLQVLDELREGLLELLARAGSYVGRAFKPIRLLNDTLLARLPDQLRKDVISHFEIFMLNSQDGRLLEGLSEWASDAALTRRAGQLAAMKRMHDLVSLRTALERPDLCINILNLRDQITIDNFHIATLTLTESGTVLKRKVLIERKAYREECSREEVATELIGRVEAIAELLASNERPAMSRVLQCYGYFHDLAHCEFGLVYDLSEYAGSEGEDASLNTLNSLFQGSSHRYRLPPLGVRFRIATELACSLLDFHKTSWLHESISSKYIALIHPPGSNWNIENHGFYILGFLNSRQNDPKAFTVGPPEDENEMAYHHPQYFLSTRYRAEFDYYSLGLVLLEIGHWKSLLKLTEKVYGSPEDLRDHLLIRRVPQLSALVGEHYRQAVEACLTGSFQSANAEEGTVDAASLHHSFKQLVIDRLSRCSA